MEAELHGCDWPRGQLVALFSSELCGSALIHSLPTVPAGGLVLVMLAFGDVANANANAGKSSKLDLFEICWLLIKIQL